MCEDAVDGSTYLDCALFHVTLVVDSVIDFALKHDALKGDLNGACAGFFVLLLKVRAHPLQGVHELVFFADFGFVEGHFFQQTLDADVLELPPVFTDDTVAAADLWEDM